MSDMDFVEKETEFELTERTLKFTCSRPKALSPDEILEQLITKYGKTKDIYHKILSSFSRMTDESLCEVVENTHAMKDNGTTTLNMDGTELIVTKSEIEDLLLYACGIKLK